MDGNLSCIEALNYVKTQILMPQNAIKRYEHRLIVSYRVSIHKKLLWFGKGIE